MRIALAQICATANVERNLRKIRERSREAASQGAKVVVFPEATMIAFGNNLVATAEQYLTCWRSTLHTIAAETDITVVVGEFEREPQRTELSEPVSAQTGRGARVRNLLSVYRPDGMREEYAKIHLYDAFGYQESQGVAAGEVPVVVNVDGCLFGLAICYDVRFPKLFAQLSRAGAEVILVAASWSAGETKAEQWRLLVRARALDSNVFVVAVDQADPRLSGEGESVRGAPTGVGGSLVADPFGSVCAQLGGEEGLMVVDLDRAEVVRAKETIPVLRHAKLGY